MTHSHELTLFTKLLPAAGGVKRGRIEQTQPDFAAHDGKRPTL
jgi:hypothetical protein